jgi:cytochrome P450
MFDEAFARDPWPVLRSLREEGGVHRVRTPDGPPAWLVTRFHDVRSGLLDERLSTNLRFAQGEDYRGFSVPASLDAFQSSDPDDLAQLRHVVIAELRPRRLGEWNDRATDLVRRLLCDIDGTGQFDFVTRVALPLPAEILGGLLGLPDTERTSLTRWAESTLVSGATPRARDTLSRMGQIIAAAITHGRPAGSQTMLGRLVLAGDTGVLTPDQVTALLFYLLFVWYEVLIDLIAGAVQALSVRPEQLTLVRSTGRWPDAVEELLRLLSPQVLASPRFAVCDLEIAGHRIAAGQTVLLCLASANHDPEIFDGPDDLNIARRANPHLGLGHGMHACVGTGLLRPVLAAILEQVFERWPNLQMADDPSKVTWRSGFRHRGPAALAVRPQ